MLSLIAPIENFAIGQKTTLSADIVAALTVIPVTNAEGFAANDYIVLGTIGSEKTQLRQIASITGQNITVTTAFTFAQPSGTYVTRLQYNKRKFYRSATETGTFVHLSTEGSPIEIAVDSPEGTQFDDSSGAVTSWYKATYFNSELNEETDISESVASQAGESSSYTTIFKIRQEAGFENNDYLSSEIIGRYRDEAQMQVDGTLAITYATPFTSIPKLVTHITTLLAAGFLLAKEYGVEADVDISKTGQRKIDRAEELLKKIKDGDILLIAPGGAEISKNSTVMASGSNKYDESDSSKGQLFNIADENFKMTDPAEPTSSSNRLASITRVVWSQK